jgi:hypothetical protein
VALAMAFLSVRSIRPRKIRSARDSCCGSGMSHEKYPTQPEPVEQADMDPRKKTKHEQVLPADAHSRTPDTEPEKEKRSDDL